MRHAGIVDALDDPALGPIEVVGPAVLLSATPGAIAGPAPTFDEHGDEIRRDGWLAAGLPSAAGRVADALDGAPLDGLRLVDFATFFASPYGARLLSDLGAEVIKVESIDGDPMRPLPEMFEGANRGKTGTSVNLKHPQATAVIEALVKGADVVQHNLRPGVAERLGIDAAALRRIEPDLIYHYSPGYGSSGPKSMLQSFAPLLSGFVGLFAIGAGVGNRPHATFGNEDYYNGLLGACACLLAVVHRERTGEGQDVESPQLHSSVFTTSEYYKAGGEYRSVIPRVGRGLYGWSTGYRLYQCLDDWLCVTCTEDEQVAALARAVLPPDVYADLLPERPARRSPGDQPAERAARAPLRRADGRRVGGCARRRGRAGRAGARRDRGWPRRASTTPRCSPPVDRSRSTTPSGAASGCSATSSTRGARPRPARAGRTCSASTPLDVLMAAGYSREEVDELVREGAVRTAATYAEA